MNLLIPVSQLRSIAICAFAFSASGLLWAQSAPEASEKPPLWEIGGLGLGVSQQAYPGSDQQVNQVLAVPYFIYRGQILRADRENLGLRAIKTDKFELDLGFAGSLGGGSSTITARQGMPELGTLIEAGPRAKWNLPDVPGWGRLRAELPVRAVFDLSDSAKHKGWSTEPKLVFDGKPINGWRYSASISAVLADCELANTFYKVTPGQATASRAAYNAKAGLISTRLAASVSRPLNPDWTLFGFARIDTVAGAANEASSLVRKKTGASVGIGVVYTFMRSEARAGD